MQIPKKFKKFKTKIIIFSFEKHFLCGKFDCRASSGTDAWSVTFAAPGTVATGTGAISCDEQATHDLLFVFG